MSENQTLNQNQNQNQNDEINEQPEQELHVKVPFRTKLKIVARSVFAAFLKAVGGAVKLGGKAANAVFKVGQTVVVMPIMKLGGLFTELAAKQIAAVAASYAAVAFAAIQSLDAEPAKAEAASAC